MPPRPILERVLSDRRVPWILSAIYFALGLIFIKTDYTLNDEGLYTFMSSDQTRHAFAPVFFFQKAKPVLSLLYMLPVSLGLTSFFVAHIVVAALTIPLASETARALKLGLPNFPAFIVACSPIFLFCGPAGLANSDG